MTEPRRAHCDLCQEDVIHDGATPSMIPLMEAVDDHMRLVHPDRYHDGADGVKARWPDGGLVVDETAVADPTDP